MKFFYFFALGLVSPALAFAQETSVVKEGQSIEIAYPVEAIFVEGDDISSRHKSKSSGLYYDNPEGIMYYRLPSSNSGSGAHRYSEYFVPCYDTFKYVNMSNDPSHTYWNYKSTAGEIGQNLEPDEEGNFEQSLTPGESSTVMYLYDEGGTDFYNMSVNGSNLSYLHYIYGSGYQDDLAWMGFIDNKSVYSVSSNLDTEYLYGRGKAYDMGFTVYDVGHYGDPDYEHYFITSYPTDYVEEEFYAPASPMYVDGVYVAGNTHCYYGESGDTSYNPFRNDAVATMEIYDTETGELMETLTATTGDWTFVYVVYSVVEGEDGDYVDAVIPSGHTKFSKKENGKEVPFVIDRAVTIKICGFDNDDLDLGFNGNKISTCDYDAGVGDAYMYFYDPTGRYEIATKVHYNNVGLALNFNAVMDKVSVSETHANITINAEGTSCSNNTPGAYGFGGVLVQTALPWKDADGNANYSLADAPDWITGVSATSYSGDKNTYKMTIQAEPNIGSDRSAVVHIQCKGYADGVGINITQTGGYVEDGINEVTSSTTPKDGATYNLAGQRVNDTAKGIIIVDGKKVIK